jgi:hypothetical protein
MGASKMNFELPESTSEEFQPLQKELEEASIENWTVSLEALEALVEGNEGLQDLLEDVLDQCLRYAKSVVEQIQTLHESGHGEESSLKDGDRTRTHTATQDTIRAFVRNLVKAGKTNTEIFPLLPNPESRAACGQFALRLTLSRGVKAIS